MNVLQNQQTTLVAHRGAQYGPKQQRYPENTLLSFAEAIQQKAKVIECDIQLTRDHEIICLHDITLERTAVQSRKSKQQKTSQQLTTPIHQLSYHDIQRHPVGIEHTPGQWITTHVPRLLDVIALLGPNTELFVEIKTQDPMLLHLIENNEILFNCKQLTFISFYSAILFSLRRKLPQFRTLLLSSATETESDIHIDNEQTLKKAITLAQQHQIDGLGLELQTTLSAKMIDTIHQNRLASFVWTSAKDDTLKNAQRMIAAKVQYYNTDRPLQLSTALEKEGR
jgi:glycerophosphoryl diester phosphodiesterase